MQLEVGMNLNRSERKQSGCREVEIISVIRKKKENVNIYSKDERINKNGEGSINFMLGV